MKVTCNNTLFLRWVCEKRKYKAKRRASPKYGEHYSLRQNVYDVKKGSILKALTENIFSSTKVSKYLKAFLQVVPKRMRLFACS